MAKQQQEAASHRQHSNKSHCLNLSGVIKRITVMLVHANNHKKNT
jgi:hypothetical protein